jgi:hypothetical protein
LDIPPRIEPQFWDGKLVLVRGYPDYPGKPGAEADDEVIWLSFEGDKVKAYALDAGNRAPRLRGTYPRALLKSLDPVLPDDDRVLKVVTTPRVHLESERLAAEVPPLPDWETLRNLPPDQQIAMLNSWLQGSPQNEASPGQPEPKPRIITFASRNALGKPMAVSAYKAVFDLHDGTVLAVPKDDEHNVMPAEIRSLKVLRDNGLRAVAPERVMVRIGAEDWSAMIMPKFVEVFKLSSPSMASLYLNGRSSRPQLAEMRRILVEKRIEIGDAHIGVAENGDVAFLDPLYVRLGINLPGPESMATDYLLALLSRTAEENEARSGGVSGPEDGKRPRRKK